jgi:hypothetical protein
LGDLLFVFSFKEETSSGLDAIVKNNIILAGNFKKVDESMLVFNDNKPKTLLADIDSIIINEGFFLNQVFSSFKISGTGILEAMCHHIPKGDLLSTFSQKRLLQDTTNISPNQ